MTARRIAAGLATLAVAGCGGSAEKTSTTAASPTPTPVKDKIKPPPVRDVEEFGGQGLTATDGEAFAKAATKALRTGNERAFAALIDPRRPAVVRQQRTWFRNVRRVPMREREVYLVATRAAIDSSGKKELTADVGFEHRIRGVDARPATEWYQYGFRKRRGKLLVSSVRGAAPDPGSGRKSSRYYRQAWDDGEMAAVVGSRSVLLGPAADRGTLQGLRGSADAAVRSAVEQFASAGVPLPSGIRRAGFAFTLQSPQVADLFDYFGGKVTPTEANFGGFAQPVFRTERTSGVVFDDRRPVTTRIVLARSELSRDIATTLRHEMIHALEQSLGGYRLPTWIAEGSAVYLSDPPAGEAASRSGDGRAALASGGGVPEDDTFYSGDDTAVGRNYDTAYVLISYLADRYGRDGLIRRLGRVASGKLNGAQFGGADLVAKARKWAS